MKIKNGRVGSYVQMHQASSGPLGRIINEIEEIFIALILGLMTAITFANVIARYVFNSNMLWALETTVFLFAWLVLIGAAYCVKTKGHLGVDALLNAVSPRVRRTLALISAACCLLFSILLLIGSWNFWAPFAALPMLDGTLRDQAWYEVNDIPMLDFLRFIEAPMNAGEAYEKMPRFIPYAALPIGVFLMTLRFIQLAVQVWRRQTDMLIVSHETEEIVEDAAAKPGKEG